MAAHQAPPSLGFSRQEYWSGVPLTSPSWNLLTFKGQCSCIGEGNGNPLQCSCLRIPGTGEPGGLPSMGSHRVGRDWSDLAAAAANKHRFWFTYLSYHTQAVEKEVDASVYPGKFSVSSVTFEHLKLQKGHFVLGSLLLKGLFGCYLCVENYSL